jgi:glycosyltransferase involved in cell wall biosynthesis
MKVIQVCAVGSTAQVLLRPQCHFLREQGFEVEFSFTPGPQTAILCQEGFKVHEISISRKLSPIADLMSVFRLVSLFRKEKPDIVHTHTSKGGGVGRIAAFFAKVPCVIHTIHGFPFDENSSGIKKTVYSIIEKFLARFTDVLLSQSSEDIATARHMGILCRSGLPIYIGNGIDIDRFLRSSYLEMREKTRSRLGISDETVMIITVGRINKEKGYYELIEALRNLKSIEWVAVLVGADDGAELNIRDLVSKYDLKDKVFFLGRRDDIPELLNASDIFVLPTHREGVPRSVIEAQIMGLPAIVTNIRGCREIVIHEETGVIVPPQQVRPLINAIDRLIKDKSLRVEMGRAGSKRARECFAEKLVFERILKVYKIIASKKSRSEIYNSIREFGNLGIRTCQ